MKKLCKKGSLKNFSADAPIRCLEESEEKLVAGTVMEILGKEALAEQLMDQILTSMQEPINTEVKKYAQARGKMVQELTEEEVQQSVDVFADEFLSRMMKLLLQVQNVPIICKYLSQNGAHEDFDEDVYENYNKISFYRKWDHLCTKLGKRIAKILHFMDDKTRQTKNLPGLILGYWRCQAAFDISFAFVAQMHWASPNSSINLVHLGIFYMLRE